MNEEVRLFSVLFTARSRSDAEHMLPVTLHARVEQLLGAALQDYLDEGVLAIRIVWEEQE